MRENCLKRVQGCLPSVLELNPFKIVLDETCLRIEQNTLIHPAVTAIES